MKALAGEHNDINSFGPDEAADFMQVSKDEFLLSAAGGSHSASAQEHALDDADRELLGMLSQWNVDVQSTLPSPSISEDAFMSAFTEGLAVRASQTHSTATTAGFSVQPPNSSHLGAASATAGTMTPPSAQAVAPIATVTQLPQRSSLARAFVGAAAVAAVVVGGLVFSAHSSAPGDALWPVNKKLFSKHAISIELVSELSDKLQDAENSAASGDIVTAREILRDVDLKLSEVPAVSDRVSLLQKRDSISRSIERRGNADSLAGTRTKVVKSPTRTAPTTPLVTTVAPVTTTAASTTSSTGSTSAATSSSAASSTSSTTSVAGSSTPSVAVPSTTSGVEKPSPTTPVIATPTISTTFVVPVPGQTTASGVPFEESKPENPRFPTSMEKPGEVVPTLNVPLNSQGTPFIPNSNMSAATLSSPQLDQPLQAP